MDLSMEGNEQRCDTIDNKYYEAALPGSLAERLAILARNRIYQDFLRLCRPKPAETILDIGVSDVAGTAVNVLERCYPFRKRVTAAGIGSGEQFRRAFPLSRLPPAGLCHSL
jgi:hypothetical protein